MGNSDAARSIKAKVFSLVNLTIELKSRYWSALYKPFLKSMGRGARLEKVYQLTAPHRISLGIGANVMQGARLEAFTAYREQTGLDGEIVIGDGTIIGPYVHIGAAAKLLIGARVLMASYVFISDHDHGYADTETFVAYQPLTISPVVISDDVWLGEKVTVLKGVTIGHHAIIGAGSVVTKDIPPYAIAAGSPARVIAMRETGNDLLTANRH
ncbi:MAG TPA: acyltransferase [Capsulimonadaceae bacterium]|jgi:acetyltransferase-like isoleucine patch superfamily enzyme